MRAEWQGGQPLLIGRADLRYHQRAAGALTAREDPHPRSSTPTPRRCARLRGESPILRRFELALLQEPATRPGSRTRATIAASRCGPRALPLYNRARSGEAGGAGGRGLPSTPARSASSRCSPVRPRVSDMAAGDFACGDAGPVQQRVHADQPHRAASRCSRAALKELQPLMIEPGVNIDHVATLRQPAAPGT